MRALRTSLVILAMAAAGCSRSTDGKVWTEKLADKVVGVADAAPRPSVWSERPKDKLPPGFVPPTSLAPLVKELKPAVVNISTTQVVHRRVRGAQDPFAQFFGMFGEQQGDALRQSLGSGFIVNAKGLVITNNHVIDEADEIKVKLADGREFNAQVLGKDPKVDLALLKLQGNVKDLPIVYLGNSDELEVGDWVLAIGNPFGLDHSVSHGIVSAKERVIGAGQYDDFIQTDAPINPGNSGGPLFNTRGEVVGVNTAILSPDGKGSVGIGFAVPVNVLKEELPQLESTGHVTRGYLGIRGQDLTPELASSFKVDPGHGVVVTEVTPEGPASKSGVQPGDVITEFNGRHIDNFGELLRGVALLSPGSQAKVAVLRDGRPVSLNVQVAARPEDEQFAHGTVGADRLGLRVEPVSPELARSVGVREGRGVAVADVKEDGPAYAAGLRPGDVIVELNRRPVESINAYARLLGQAPRGELVVLRVQRRSSTLYIAVRAS